MVSTKNARHLLSKKIIVSALFILPVCYEAGVKEVSRSCQILRAEKFCITGDLIGSDNHEAQNSIDCKGRTEFLSASHALVGGFAKILRRLQSLASRLLRRLSQALKAFPFPDRLP